MVMVEMWLFRREIFPLSLSFRIFLFFCCRFLSSARCANLQHCIFSDHLCRFIQQNDRFDSKGFKSVLVMNIILLYFTVISNWKWALNHIFVKLNGFLDLQGRDFVGLFGLSSLRFVKLFVTFLDIVIWVESLNSFAEQLNRCTLLVFLVRGTAILLCQC